jgi:hypothetical protein
MDSGFAAAHLETSLSWSDTQTTEREGMPITRNGQTVDCWGERSVHWLRQRFYAWPLKVIARELDEPESVIKSWWSGDARPDRKKLQKLSERFRSEGFGSFVMGAPVEGELEARMDRLVAEVIEIRAYLRAAPSRVVSRDDRGGLPLDGSQVARKTVK